jgi:hypothetical protein
MKIDKYKKSVDSISIKLFVSCMLNPFLTLKYEPQNNEGFTHLAQSYYKEVDYI